jgi:hypothetical protein
LADEALEGLAGVDATFVCSPPVPFWTLLPIGLRRLIAPLLALALLAAVAAWMLGAPGLRLTGLLSGRPAVEPTAAPSPLPTPEPGTDSKKPAPSPAAPAPRIDRFELIPSPGDPNQLLLVWQVTGADTVLVAGQEQPGEGQRPIAGITDSNFELEATSTGGTVRKSIGVRVLRAPSIVRFQSDVSQTTPGKPVVLTWSAERGQRARLQDESGLPAHDVAPENGSIQMWPETDATYTLTVENNFGREVRSIRVEVINPPSAAIGN